MAQHSGLKSAVFLLGVGLSSLAAAGFGAASAGAQSLPTPPQSAQPQPARSGTTFRVSAAVKGLQSPIWIGHAPGDRAGLWVAQQGGQLVRVTNGRKVVKLTIASRTDGDGEQGLLGVAFLPGYAKNKLVVLHSTNLSGDTRVELWKVGKTAKSGRLVRTLLRQKQPFGNHNGGQLEWGAGNTLYLGLGDGGAADDPQRNGQNLRTRLGKILSATVTPTNRPTWKVAAYGLRNPWRFAFEAQSNELWVADVGQNEIEEVSRIPLGASTPPNLGWSVFEGGIRDPDGDDALSGSGELIWPVITYRHDDEGGCSVTGGEIYRGKAIPALQGRYVYGDFCSGTIWSVAPDGAGVGQIRRESARVSQLSSFGTDSKGELYASSLGGTVYKLRAPR